MKSRDEWNDLTETPFGRFLLNRYDWKIHCLGNKAVEAGYKGQAKSFYSNLRRYCIKGVKPQKDSFNFILKLLPNCSEEELHSVFEKCRIITKLKDSTKNSLEKTKSALSPEESFFQTDYEHNTATICGERLYQNFNNNGFLFNYYNNGISFSQGFVQSVNQGKPKLGFTKEISTQLNNTFQETNANVIDKVSEEKLLAAQGFKFIILEIYIVAIYGDDGSLHWSKRFLIKSLVDDLEKMLMLDHYNCVRGKRDVDLKYSSWITAEKIHNCDRDQNFVDIHFKTPLKKNQEIEFTLEYYAQDVVDEDRIFHSTWVRFPTRYARMAAIPPNANKGMQAKLYKYDDAGYYTTQSYREYLDDLCLGDSLSYIWERYQPTLGHTYKIEWGYNFQPQQQMKLNTVEV